MTEKHFVIILFQDGLQIIPNIWLNKNSTASKWPDFVSNQRYDRAVKNMEEPQPNWVEYPITKIFGTYNKQCYIIFLVTLARRKLKEAEEMTDIDSCTEQEEYFKKSRKIRASKMIDTSSSNSEDQLSEITEFESDLPKVPSNSKIKTDFETNRKLTNKRKGAIKNSHANATEEEISAPLKIWLAHAKERVLRESAKRNENNA
ncbi:hypothetical protein ALC62_13490 [Cyphomyrmex costatus]|uniref:Uncharacterized protein n=1 Tax=Cyphomyrmex costatus TaxID=456900 RepID=A0A151I9V4_9HYME|nr:hypothetical protein ALC62_13490 [Cyphomyrmex costatus]